MRLALEHPRCWEHRLFFRVLNDDITALTPLRRRQQMAYVLGWGEVVYSVQYAGCWLSARIEAAGRITKCWEELINVQMVKAVDPVGQACGSAATVQVAHDVGAVYKEMVEFSLSTRRAHLPEAWQDVVPDLARPMDDFICQMEQMAKYGLTQTETLGRGEGTGTALRFEVTEPASMGPLREKLDALIARYRHQLQ